MPRYYFDVDTCYGTIHDDVGIEIPDADTVKAEASSIVMEVARIALRQGTVNHVAATVRGEDDCSKIKAILSLTFEDIPDSTS